MSSTGLSTVHHNATQAVLGANTFTRLIPRCLLVLLFILSLSLVAQLLLQLLFSTVVKVIIIIDGIRRGLSYKEQRVSIPFYPQGGRYHLLDVVCTGYLPSFSARVAAVYGDMSNSRGNSK